MTTAIRRVTAPSVSPVSLTEAKAHLRVDSDHEDMLIQRYIDAAVSHIDGEGTLGRAMITQDWAQWETQAPGWPRLQMGPFQSLVSIEYYDADSTLQTATLADFETRLDGDFVVCKPKEDRAWPNAETRRDAIKITYRAGYGDAATDVPEGLRHAIFLLLSHWYENRVAVDERKLMPIPYGVDALINNERVAWYG